MYATITLTTANYGSSVIEWAGDIHRPDAEILAECRAILVANREQADCLDQTDADLLERITGRRRQIDEDAEMAAEDAAIFCARERLLRKMDRADSMY